MWSAFGVLLLISTLSSVSSYQAFMRQILGAAFMGDALSMISTRFQCIGTGKNFTRFLLYTRLHPDQHQSLVPGDQWTLDQSDYDPALPTKVVIHGFVDNMFISDWMQRMKSKLLSVGDFNVILVDWNCGNEFPYYQAVQNSKLTAEELRKLISFLQEAKGANPSDFHLIGHSLGGQIAALVGHNIPHLGRISGLDPAGPKFYDAPLEERLDPRDALFVDTIHTDAGSGLMEGLGLHAQMGHVDFYPNGGKDQPGCHGSPLSILPRIGIHRAARYYITCDHFRSIEYYMDSIRPAVEARYASDEITCQPIGVACRDWETFEQGRCADCTHPGDCAAMGYLSDLHIEKGAHLAKHEYYLKTSDEEPFCLFQYQVIVETGCDQDFCSEAVVASKSGVNPGDIRLEMTMKRGRMARLNINSEDTELKPGGQYVYLATTKFPVTEVQSAKVYFGQMTRPEFRVHSSPSSGPSLKKIQVVPIELADKIERFSLPQMTVLCGSPNKTIGRNQYLELTVNDC